MQIYNEKEQSGQREIQNVLCEENRAPEGVMELSPMLKEIKTLKKSLMLFFR